MSDWAKECAERWRWKTEDGSEVLLEAGDAILGAVREALAKAEGLADEGVCAEDCDHDGCHEAREIRDNIRALGVAK